VPALDHEVVGGVAEADDDELRDVETEAVRVRAGLGDLLRAARDLRSPPENSTSVPLIRGDPSRRSVAIVLCVKPSNSDRARAVSSGASASTSPQLAMGRVYRSAPAPAHAATAAWP
jgi:hypothetical protein